MARQDNPPLGVQDQPVWKLSGQESQAGENGEEGGKDHDQNPQSTIFHELNGNSQST